LKIFKNFSVYAFTSALNSGAVFLLLPLVTSYLTANQYGIYSIFLVAIQSSFFLIGLSCNGALQVEYYKLEKDKFPIFVSTTIFLNIIIFILCLIISLLFDKSLGQLIGVPSEWLWIIPIIAFTQVVHQSILAILQVQNKAIVFGVFNSVFAIFNIGISIFSLKVLNSSWQGLLLSFLTAYLIIFLVGIFYLVKKKLVVPKIDSAYFNDILKFGIPLIPHALSGLVIEFGNRLFIAKFVSLTALGIYSTGFQMGKVISLLETSFTQAFVPVLFDKLTENTKESKKKVVELSYIFLGLLLLAVFVLSFLSPYIFKLFIGASFQGGAQFVFIIALSYFFSGVYKMFVNYLFYTKKTYLLSIIAVINILSSILFNYYFIENFGLKGAAYSLLCSQILNAMIVIIVSNKIYKMPWLSV
jgi:O-antigen/teichoic acid export membrane protein